MSDYWIKREEEQRKRDRKNDQEASKRLRRIYNQAITEMESQIDAWFAKYANENGITMAEAKKLASTLDIKQYSQLAKLYVQTNDRSDKANKEMSIYNLTMKTSRLQLLIMALNDAMTKAADQAVNLVEDEIQSRIKEEYERQAGILGETVPGSLEQALETLTYASFHSASWADRIWKNNDAVRKMISRTLTDYLIRGIATNQAVKDLKSQIKGDVKKAENAARRLVVTERQRAAGQAQMKIYEDSGIRHFRFIAEPNCCKICAGLEGQVFEVAKGESGINMRPMHPYCRCSTAMANDPANADFNEWLALYDTVDPKDVPAWSEYQQFSRSKSNHRLDLEEWMTFDQYDRDRLELPWTIHENKIRNYLLKPGTPHYQEFADVGYGPSEIDYDRLYQDIYTNYPHCHSVPDKRRLGYQNREEFAVIMYLGSPEKSFAVAWQKDGDHFKLTSAYRYDKKKEKR